MPVATTEVLRKLSINTGPGNSTAQGNPNDSIGGFMSSTQLTDASLDNLYDDVSGAENAASAVDYRCFFFHNSNASATCTNTRIYIFSETAGGTSVAIGLDAAGVVAFNSAAAQAARAANETTAPAGVTFSTTPVSYATGLTPGAGTVGSNQVIAVWIRRTAANTASQALDGVVVRFEYDTV